MIEVELEFSDQAMDLADRIAGDLRAGALVKAARAAGRRVVLDAKPRITRPGYQGDKKDLKPLRDTLKVVVREYKFRVLAVIGTTWPEGAHGHLVENGHIGTKKDGTQYHVPPHPFLRPAAEGTKAEQSAAILSELRKVAPKK